MESKQLYIRPLVVFFLLSCLLAWGIMALFIAQNYGLLSADIPFEPFLILGSWTPNIAAFLVIAFVLKQKGGIRQLLGGWLKFRVPAIWYLVTVTPVALSVLSMFIYRLIYGVIPVTEIVFNPMGMLALLIISTVTGATGEELGWRGFALPRLQNRLSALNASLVLGVIWTLWHAPLWFAGLGYENIPFGTFTLLILSGSVLITWACNNSKGSMVIATLFHLMMNVALNIIEFRALLVYALLFFAFTVFVVIRFGPARLSLAADLPIDRNTGDWKA